MLELGGYMSDLLPVVMDIKIEYDRFCIICRGMREQHHRQYYTINPFAIATISLETVEQWNFLFKPNAQDCREEDHWYPYRDHACGCAQLDIPKDLVFCSAYSENQNSFPKQVLVSVCNNCICSALLAYAKEQPIEKLILVVAKKIIEMQLDDSFSRN